MTAPASNPVTDWLLKTGWQITDHRDFTKQYGKYLLEAGMDVFRIRITVRLLHPQVMGYSYTWCEDSEDVALFEATHDLLETDMYRKSPFAALFDDKAGAIRRKLEDPDCLLDYPILQDLIDEGATDYVALPLDFSDGRRSAITLTCRKKGGFSKESLSMLYDSLQALAIIIENWTLKHTASVLLQTYLGRETGSRVLDGHVKRGDGQNIRAVIWFSDLRGSTRLAEHLPRERFLEILNLYFDCTAGAVLQHGGEVLRYIGDAVLAIFPIGETSACPETHSAAQNAERAARQAIEDINALPKGLYEIKCGIGLHVGEVMYGNIGTRDRLEFSVIGSSANEAARMEDLTKTLNTPLVVSEQFIDISQNSWAFLGEHPLRDFQRKRAIYTFHDLVTT